MDSTTPKPFVFVLMPFAPEFDDLYQLGIKPACEFAGAYAERVDEQLFVGSITQRIYNQISKADVIVADMTGRNPNVFYEVGYSHALGKPVILLSREATDIPFDLKDYPHIIYGGSISSLIPSLARKVSWCIESRGSSLLQTLSHLRVFSGGYSLSDAPVLIYSTREPHSDGYSLFFDIENSPERVLRTEKFVFSLLTPERYERALASEHRGRRRDAHKPPRGGVLLSTVNMSDHQCLHVSPAPIELYPGAWTSLRLFLSAEPSISEDIVESMGVRLSTEIGMREYSFQVAVLLNQENEGS